MNGTADFPNLSVLDDVTLYFSVTLVVLVLSFMGKIFIVYSLFTHLDTDQTFFHLRV